MPQVDALCRPLSEVVDAMQLDTGLVIQNLKQARRMLRPPPPLLCCNATAELRGAVLIVVLVPCCWCMGACCTGCASQCMLLRRLSVVWLLACPHSLHTPPEAVSFLPSLLPAGAGQRRAGRSLAARRACRHEPRSAAAYPVPPRRPRRQQVPEKGKRAGGGWGLGSALPADGQGVWLAGAAASCASTCRAIWRDSYSRLP